MGYSAIEDQPEAHALCMEMDYSGKDVVSIAEGHVDEPYEASRGKRKVSSSMSHPNSGNNWPLRKSSGISLLTFVGFCIKLGSPPVGWLFVFASGGPLLAF